ncbi:MAG: helix-turn-helix domain-containing protein [Acidobacteriales bacterium]|nr:helix-turn-helix domain-containing protein [Terriglobales bacterium]
MTKSQAQKITKALADPMRFQVFQRIAATDELACTTLKSKLPITAATLSHHIKELTKAGLITCRQQGKYTYLAADRRAWRAYLESLKNIVQKP